MYAVGICSFLTSFLTGGLQLKTKEQHITTLGIPVAVVKTIVAIVTLLAHPKLKIIHLVWRGTISC